MYMTLLRLLASANRRARHSQILLIMSKGASAWLAKDSTLASQAQVAEMAVNNAAEDQEFG